MTPKTRRFGLGDLMILIAAMAVATIGVRSLWQGRVAVVSTRKAAYDRLLLTAVLSACATPMTVAALLFRVRRPRPAWRRVAIQLGTAALIACLVIFAARGLEMAGSFLSPDVYGFGGRVPLAKSSPIRFSDSTYLVLVRSSIRDGVIGSLEPIVCHSVLVASVAWPCGSAVAAVWSVLALSGRWRPEPSWIDRLGRALGIMWIAISVLAAVPG